MKLFSILYVAFIAILVLLTGLGHFPDALQFYRKIPYGDKVGHFFLMGLLALALSSLSQFRTIEIKGYQFFQGSLFCLILLTAEELSQIFLIHRTFSLIDLASNYLGILIIGQLIPNTFLKKDHH